MDANAVAGPSRLAAAPQGNPFPFFHLLPDSYSLKDPSSLSSAQLAAAWILHPAEYGAAKRKIGKVFRSRREKQRHLLGVKSIGRYATNEERRQDPCFGFELQDLAWEIPEDLDSLSSAQLAILPFHPDSAARTDLLPFAASIFTARRESDMAQGLSVPGLPSLPPRQERSNISPSARGPTPTRRVSADRPHSLPPPPLPPPSPFISPPPAPPSPQAVTFTDGILPRSRAVKTSAQPSLSAPRPPLKKPTTKVKPPLKKQPLKKKAPLPRRKISPHSAAFHLPPPSRAPLDEKAAKITSVESPRFPRPSPSQGPWTQFLRDVGRIHGAARARDECKGKTKSVELEDWAAASSGGPRDAESAIHADEVGFAENDSEEEEENWAPIEEDAAELGFAGDDDSDDGQPQQAGSESGQEAETPGIDYESDLAQEAASDLLEDAQEQRRARFDTPSTSRSVSPIPAIAASHPSGSSRDIVAELAGVAGDNEEDMDLDSGSDEEVGAIVVAGKALTSIPIEANPVASSTVETPTTIHPQIVVPVGQDRAEMESETSARVEQPATEDQGVEELKAVHSMYAVKQEQLGHLPLSVKTEAEETSFGNVRSTALSFSWDPVDVTMDDDTPPPPPRLAADVFNDTRSFFDTLDATLASSSKPTDLLPAPPLTLQQRCAPESEQEDVKPLLTERRQRSTSPRDTKPFISRLPPSSTSASTPPAPARQPHLVFNFNPNDEIPTRYTREWSILYAAGLEYNSDAERVWALLSPPHLPRPIAINTVPIPVSRVTIAYVAYANSQDADLAKHGLTGTVHGRDHSKLVVVDYDNPRGDSKWKWEMASDELKSLVATNDLPRAENDRSRRTSLPPRPPSPAPPRPSRPPQDSPSYPRTSLPPKKRPRSPSPPRTSSLAQASSGDIVPPELLMGTASLHLVNLPQGSTADDVYRYIDDPGLIGVAVRRQSQGDKRPGSAFLLFSSKSEGGNIAAQYISKKAFPGGKAKMWYDKGKERNGAWRWDEMGEGFVTQHAAAHPGAEQALRAMARRGRRRSASPRRRVDPAGRRHEFGSPRPPSPPPRRMTRSPPPPLQRRVYPPSRLLPSPAERWPPAAAGPDRTQGRRHEWSNSASPPYQPPPPSSYGAGTPSSNLYPPPQHAPTRSWPASADTSAPTPTASLPPWATPSTARAQPVAPPPPATSDLGALLASLDPSVLAQVQNASQPLGAAASAEDEYDPKERLNLGVGGSERRMMPRADAGSAPASRWMD